MTDSYGQLNDGIFHVEEGAHSVNVTHRVNDLACNVPFVNSLPPGFTLLRQPGAPEDELLACQVKVVGQGQVLAVYFADYSVVSLYVLIKDTPSTRPPEYGLPVSDASAKQYWKKVDLHWPKIDSRTGQEYDAALAWYSPLAE